MSSLISATLRPRNECSPNSSKGTSAPTISEDTEMFVQQSPSIAVQLFAHIMTGIYFVESVGATFILWLFPSLAPQARIYMVPMPHQHAHSHRGHHPGSHHRHSHTRKESGDESDGYLERLSLASTNLSDESASISTLAREARETSSTLVYMQSEDPEVEIRSWAKIEQELLAAAK